MCNKNSRMALCILVITLLMIPSKNLVYAESIIKGNPVATYYEDEVLLSSGQSLGIDDDYIALFINGTFIPNNEGIVKNDFSLVPLRLISEKLGCTVSWDGKTQGINIEKNDINISLNINSDKATINNQETALQSPPVLYKNTTYVPLRFISENLDAIVQYAPAMKEEYTYYYDTKIPLSPENTVIRCYPNIIIDERYNETAAITKDEAMIKVQQECRKGLENFATNLLEDLTEPGMSSDRFDADCRHIANEIDRMVYIGEVSRYYKYSIGVYDILFDKYNHNIFFVIYSDGIIVRKVDINDPGLFTYIFIVG